MSRPERLLLLVFLDLVLVLLVVGLGDPVMALIGAAAGAFPAVVVAGRLKRLSGRMDARLGIVEQRPQGVLVSRIAVRAGAHLAVLAGLWVLTVLVPFVGDDLFTASAAAATAFAAVLTAWGLRR